MDTPARPPWYAAEAVVLAALGALVAAAVFAGGGSRGSALATVGLAALASQVVCVAARRRGVPVARPRGGSRSRRRGRPDRLGGALHLLVDRRRPLLGMARPRTRLRVLPRARPAGRGGWGRGG